MPNCIPVSQKEAEVNRITRRVTKKETERRLSIDVLWSYRLKRKNNMPGLDKDTGSCYIRSGKEKSEIHAKEMKLYMPCWTNAHANTGTLIGII